MYQQVLIPTDGSDGTKQAIKHGMIVAKRFDATVHALSVRSEGPYGSLTGDEETDEVDARLERALERIELEGRRYDVDVVTELRQGVPHEEILAYAEEEAVDVIVMGTHGRTGVDRVLVGSVTERVVREATVPVVTVRMHDDVSVRESEVAASIATTTLDEQGYENATITDEPHRTSGSWIVPIETDGSTGHVHIDATSGEARIAGIDR